MAIPPVDEHEFMRLARECLDNTERFLKNHPTRIAGTPQCVQAAEDLKMEFDAACDTARKEPFDLRPGALWVVGKVVAVCALLGAVLSVFLASSYRQPWTLLVYLGAVVCLAGLVYAIFVYVLSRTTFDWLFPHKPGCNVVGEVNPPDVKRLIIVVGHHDAPYVFSFLERWTSLASIRFFLAMAGYLWIAGYSLVLAVQLAAGRFQAPHGIWIWATAAALVLAAQLFFMITSRPSPGAGDNLNSCFMALTLARYFRSQKVLGHPLVNTKLVLLSTDAEEAGKRGAKAFVHANLTEKDADTTRVLNLDTIIHPDDLTVTTKDRNGTLSMSKTMVADICAAANRLGVTITARPLRFGAGGTDAAPFAEAGIPVTSIIGMSMAIVSRGHEYHTSRDLVPTINAAAVRDALMIAAEYVRRVDAQP